MISCYLKGIFKQKPSRLKCATSYDVIRVLNYIKKIPPLEKLKLNKATEKLVTLLALTAAQRFQILALINIENIDRSNSNITIKIKELIKTSKSGAFQSELILPFSVKNQVYVQLLRFWIICIRANQRLKK